MPVSARFHATRDAVLSAVDKVFAEPIKLSFLKPNKTVDPDRPARMIEGVLRVGSGEASRPGGGFAQSWSTRIVAGKAELHIDPVAYPGLDIRQGDKVRADSRIGQPWFEVLHVDDRSSTRLVVELSES